MLNLSEALKTTNILHFRKEGYHLNYIRLAEENPDGPKNMLLLKKPQFLPDHYEILTKEGTHENLILTKFCNDRIKIVDF